MSLADIAYMDVFGLELIIAAGALSFLLLGIAIASIVLNKKGIRIIPYRLHKPVGMLGFILAGIHVGLAVGIRLGL